MGHTEMLLAVAGLDDKAVRERTRKLAEGDWSAFPPAERAAFAYARKMSKEPWSITDEDVACLHRPVDVDVQNLDDAVCLRFDFDFGDRLDFAGGDHRFDHRSALDGCQMRRVYIDRRAFQRREPGCPTPSPSS